VGRQRQQRPPFQNLAIAGLIDALVAPPLGGQRRTSMISPGSV
jgi:hypothetical protein